MNTQILRSLRTAILIMVILAAPVFAKNRLVNMIPQSRSGETNQDSEPTIAVDPKNHMRMAGSAFTWDNLTQSAMTTSTAPIYVSQDRGNTWTLAFIVPSKVGSGFPTGDITLSFSSTLSSAQTHTTSWLYGGILSAASVGFPMVVLRAQDPFSNVTMTTLDTRTGNVDQPHTTSKTMTAAGQDKLYVGFNNGWGCIVPSGRTSTLDVSQDAAISSPTFTLDLIEARSTNCQDGFAQVAAAHSDGTVYAAFIHDFSGSPRLVVVRDDNWGIGANPFSALTDTSDGKPGSYVTGTLTMPQGTMGQQRLDASNVSIAVDPGNSDRVYVAWGDGNGANSETIHVRRSIDRGSTWSNDLFSITDALNPEVAINDIGIVGVLYQQLTAGNWETHFVHSTDMDASILTAPGTLLSSQSSTTPAGTIQSKVYLGDYASLTSAGNSFIGMFSTSNYPDKANFMEGVTYQREVDWVAHKLYADATHMTEVPTSIDPFFLEIETSICDKSKIFCNICKYHPLACYPIYDPWWKFKCPQCTLNIFIRLEDDYGPVILIDNRGKEVGTFVKLREPYVEKGMRYNYRLSFKPKEGVSYALKAETAKGKKFKKDFKPAYTIQKREGRG